MVNFGSSFHCSPDTKQDLYIVAVAVVQVLLHLKNVGSDAQVMMMALLSPSHWPWFL